MVFLNVQSALSAYRHSPTTLDYPSCVANPGRSDEPVSRHKAPSCDTVGLQATDNSAKKIAFVCVRTVVRVNYSRSTERRGGVTVEIYDRVLFDTVCRRLPQCRRRQPNGPDSDRQEG